METLQTKEITPYLPFKLKCKVKDLGTPVVVELHSVYADGTCTFYDLAESGKGFDSVKPVLRKLDHFKYEDINKVKEYVGMGKWCDYYDHYFDTWFDMEHRLDIFVLQAPYCIVQFFLANHFDIFNLIARRLAVESPR